jgi:hypothetical protein
MSNTANDPANIEHPMWSWLSKMGCRRRRELFILDEFDTEFYLIFDTSVDPETPESLGTCDILLSTPGEQPTALNRVRLVANARRVDVLRFMFALGVSRFSERTQKFLYEQNGVVKT